jgi:hypothetical protein
MKNHVKFHINQGIINYYKNFGLAIILLTFYIYGHIYTHDIKLLSRDFKVPVSLQIFHLSKV